MEYIKIADAARSLAKSIILSQKVPLLQEILTNAKSAVTAAIRANAVVIRARAKEDKEAADLKAKREENQAAMDTALEAVAGATEEEIAAAQEAVDADRAERAKEAEAAAQDLKKARADEDERFAKRVADAQKAVVEAQKALDEVADSKIDEDELVELTQQLIEDGRVTNLASTTV